MQNGLYSAKFAPVAQSVEHNHGKVGVSSSILLGSLFLSLFGGKYGKEKCS